MKDPPRITETSRGDLEGDLIVAMHDDRPARGARDRAIVALGLGGAAFGASTGTTAALASKGAALGTVVAVGKWIALGIGGGALAVGLLHRAPQVSRVAATSPRPPIEVAPPVQPAVVGPREAEPLTSEAAPTPSSPRLPQATQSSPPRVPKRDLADEIALLDRARAATLAGEPVGALELLGSYAKRFPRGALAPEATMLRIEALAASGQTSAAMALARAVLAASPTSPHAERLQAMAAGDFAR